MPNNLELNPIHTLIITVGTRQVGWRCKDGVVRCFGADGDRGHPSHIDQLYQELQIKRGEHEVGNPNSRWGVRDLGQRYYEYCQESLNQSSEEQQEQPAIAIENKGAVPTMAESLDICSAALVRQFSILNANPQEPEPLYQKREDGSQSARSATEYTLIPVSDYFWPLERTRVISAWERGDFREAYLWLQAHQSRHRILYQLAGYLSLSTNWEIATFLNNKNFATGWLNSKALRELTDEQQIQQWRVQLQQTQSDQFRQIWESYFLIELALIRQNYTEAFLQFCLTLERLLYCRYQQENWLQYGWITVPDDWDNNQGTYEPTFSKLIQGLQEKNDLNRQNKFYSFLHNLRDKRNDVIHRAKPITLADLRSLWQKRNLPFPDNTEEVLNTLIQVLQKVCSPTWQIPSQTLLDSFYQWGLKILQAESTV